MNYGRYETDAEIGKGAMGVVYRAKDPKLGRHVAIKVLNKNLLGDGEARQRFLKEAEISAGLSHHHNIVTIHDQGEEGDEVYIVMELLEGKSLSTMIGTLERKDVLSIGKQMTAALDFAHPLHPLHPCK